MTHKCWRSHFLVRLTERFCFLKLTQIIYECCRVFRDAAAAIWYSLAPLCRCTNISKSHSRPRISWARWNAVVKPYPTEYVATPAVNLSVRRHRCSADPLDCEAQPLATEQISQGRRSSERRTVAGSSLDHIDCRAEDETRTSESGGQPPTQGCSSPRN